MTRIALVLLLCLLVSLHSSFAQQDTASPTDSYLRSPRLGITQISTAEAPASDERYQKALELGAGWNRWPLYWDRVESKKGEFDWAAVDTVTTGDLEHGLSINAILLGRPAFYQDGVRIAGLQLPIFADGSDYPEPDKAINPDNPWANFVYQSVTRYKPGGTLAQENDWPEEWGIRVWEIWNEPDYKPFWEASILDYARLLKTAYLVIKMVDPEAKVMFAGLLYGDRDNWLARVLAIYEDDPYHEQNNWYMDLVAVHNYSYPWRSGWLVLWARQTLSAYKLKLPIWLNESGVPVWDDYPGPVWASTGQEKQLRATSEQQADFFIQSSVYAWAEGAEVVFFHQLYDDCGNQAAGTNFPYNETNTCEAGEVCAGDAFGLYRNTADALCFSHNPKPGTPRDAAYAFRLVADVFGSIPLEKPQIQVLDNRATVISFDQPEDEQRLYITWSNILDTLTLNLPVSEGALTQIEQDRRTPLTADDKGILALELPPASCDYFPFLQDLDITAVGGKPMIVLTPLTKDVLDAPTLSGDGAKIKRRRCKL